MVITPGKNFPGQKGFPTPSDIPSDTACRSFILPDNDEWLGLLMGAAELLLNPHNYFNYGPLSIDDTVDNWQLIIQDSYDRSLLGTCAPTVDAPYWDTYDDSDDESSVEDQPWYGILVPAASMRSRVIVELLDDDELTWRENLGIWAIAGFIAYAGQPGAAIKFVPFARRFVLKFRGNPLGAIAEVFIDGIKLAALDTASDEERIKAIDIQLPDDEEEHEIWVAVSEDSPPGTKLQVIRKELDPGEVYPKNLRYNTDCDCVQQTYDDGETWVDQPGQDPRHAPQFFYPPVTADDPRCQAAANMRRFFENLIETALGVISGGLDVLGIGTAIMPLFVELGPFALLFDVGLGLASSLLGLGVDVIETEFTPETFDALQCIFFCHLQADGRVNAAGLGQINAQIGAELNPDVYLIMAGCFLLMGEVGLSNAGTQGEAPADCDECDSCDWCVTLNFNDAVGNWQPNHLSGSPVGCGYDWGFTFIPGQGLVNVGCISLAASLLLPAGTEITNVAYHGDNVAGTSQAIIFNTDPGLQGTPLLRVNAFDSGAIDLVLAADTYLGILLQSPSGTTCGEAGHNIDQVTVSGKGFKPEILVGEDC